MKKSPFKKKLKITFWLVFLIGSLWVGFIPHHHPVSPSSIKVKVEQPAEPAPEITPPAPAEKPQGDEARVPPLPEKPAGDKVAVPVMPEKTEPLPAGKHPQIAIVIDDVGLDLKGSDKAIKLPSAVTLSFLPYAVRLREQAQQAQAKGHELLLHMPMEPIGHEDPGPGALLVDMPMRDLQERFESALASFTGFDGVNNHMGSKFTAYADGMTMVVDELQQRHLFFLDSRTSAQSVGKQIADQKGLPSIGRDVFLDDDQSEAAIRNQLAVTEHIAARKGYAVAIGHPHATTMAVLQEWTGEAQKRGFELVQLKTLVKN